MTAFIKLTFSVMFLFLASPAFAQEFFANLPDVPLMSGLEEMDELALNFDKPEGRIIVGAANIPDSFNEDAIYAYYSKVLPAFGWARVHDSSYLRGAEKLNIEITQGQVQRVLEISISP